MQQRDAGGRSGVRWGDAATLVGLALYAVRPALPAFLPALAGAALMAACLRPLPGDGRFSRLARAVAGGLCLYTVFGRSWFVWPAYLLVPLLVAVGLALAAGFWRDLLATLERGRLGRTEWSLIALISALAGAALIGWVALFQPDLSRVREMLPAGRCRA